MALQLKIVTPECIEYQGEINRVVVPGTLGEFEVLENHAPIISSLERGKIVYENKDGLHTLQVSGGFIEVQKNLVSICVEK
ncbi:MAG: ATP synthase F1 subunit epsilon [Prevotella sp.]|nr:ATP synthase F1 subunit epsilon [Prevotella sp.]